MKLKIENKFVFYGGLTYFLVVLCFFTLKILATFGLLNFSGADLVLNLCIQIVLMFGLPILLFSIFTKSSLGKTFSFFSFKKVSGKTVGLSFLLGICVFVFVVVFSGVWSGILSMFGLEQVSSGHGDFSPIAFVLEILLSALLPAICEETAHRGLVLRSMKSNGMVRAIVLSGLLFGLVHMNIFQFGYAFVVGMFFGAVTCLTKSIFPAMIMHFSNNALSTIWNFSLGSDWMKNGIVDGIANFFQNANAFVVLFVEFLVFSLFVWFAWFLLLKIFEESKKSSFLRFKKRFVSGFADEKDLETEAGQLSDEQMFEIYKTAQLLKFEEELKKDGKFEGNLIPNSKSAVEMVLSGDLKKPEKVIPFDNLFYYMAIGLGIFGTIFGIVLAFI